MRLYENPELFAKVTAWCEANGMDPAIMPLHPNVVIDGDRIEYTAVVAVTGKTGAPVAKLKADGTGIETERRTADLKVAPPVEVAAWMNEPVAAGS